jgi:hypothetical protein
VNGASSDPRRAVRSAPWRENPRTSPPTPTSTRSRKPSLSAHRTCPRAHLSGRTPGSADLLSRAPRWTRRSALRHWGDLEARDERALNTLDDAGRPTRIAGLVARTCPGPALPIHRHRALPVLAPCGVRRAHSFSRPRYLALSPPRPQRGEPGGRRPSLVAPRPYCVARTFDASFRSRVVCCLHAVRASERTSPACRCLPFLWPCVLLSPGPRSSASLSDRGAPCAGLLK